MRYWTIPEKIKKGELRIYFYETPPGIFHIFFYFTLGNSRQNNAQLLDILQNCVRFLGNSEAKKKRPLEIPHYFFLVTLGNSTSFLINSRKLHMPFIWYPWKFNILNLFDIRVWIFSGIAQSTSSQLNF